VAAKKTGVFAELRMNLTVVPAGIMMLVKLNIPSGARSSIFKVTKLVEGAKGPSDPSDMTGPAPTV
jgi:hypothetical protein